MTQPALARPGAPETVAERIERLIEERGLGRGDRLPPERRLAELLGVSRPSLREAIRALETMGRLRVRHGTGVWVQPPDAMRRLQASREVGLAELFAMREVLEIPAAGWAAEGAARDAPSVARLAAILESMEAATEIDDLRRHDIDFHLALAEMAGNRFLIRTMGVLHEMLRQGMDTTLTIPGRLERSRVDHRRILQAVRAGDAAGARAAMRRHIRGAQRAAAKRLAAEAAVAAR
jgi:GntR family transcriptional repressor for pyruvate dehydrogenase complex